MPFQTIPELFAAYQKQFDPTQAVGIEATIQMQIDGEGGGAYHFVIKDQTMAVVEGTHAAPDVTVRTTAANWLKVNNGELNPMMAMMTGKVKISGDLALATRLQALLGM
ncbi:MAG: SCP2 sterol-binding domain-containing protein [Bacteroidota bacterium]